MNPIDRMEHASTSPGPGHAELRDALRRVRRRWMTAVSLEAGARAAIAVAAVLFLFAAVDRIQPSSEALLITLFCATVLAVLGAAAWFLRPLGRLPSDRQVARYVEERCPELEDRLASATEWSERPGSSPFHGLLIADAASRVRDIESERIVSARVIKRSALTAVVAAAVLAGALFLAVNPGSRALGALWWRAFPGELSIEVTPGDVRLPAGRSLKIVAKVRASPLVPGVPTLSFGQAENRKTVPMTARGDGFEFEFASVSAGFPYNVAIAKNSSPEYTVTTVWPPKVDRIDVQYDYPAFTGLRARLEEDGGDIYAPVGTRIRVMIHADKPVQSGTMVMHDGTHLTLEQDGGATLDAGFKVTDDGAYRIALVDTDGLENPGETEYFIRTMDDRPPEVRIVRPGGDKQITPLEEVKIEARADDDFGLERLELVYAVRGGPERVVRYPIAASAPSVTGSHTMYVEDLDVEPGDFITYYARARDVSRAKRASEARSDIFFLEVKPFEEEFVAAQSQAMMGGGGDRSLDELAAAQKDIIIATWKLDRRSAGGKSAQDIKSVARAQGELKARAEQAAGQLAGGNRPRRRPRGGELPTQLPEPTEEPMKKAVEAMGQAETSLDALKTAEALPNEMEALNQLLKAQAEVRRRQVARQQAGGGGGSNRAQQDLSALFDRELQRQQATNYETRNSNPPQRGQSPESEALQKVKELARRQDELNRQQRDLAKEREQLSPEELKRQLERLTREQSELRRQAEELARQLARQDQSSRSQQQQQGQQLQAGEQNASGGQQQSGQSGASGQQQSSQGSGNEMREISEEMRSAASELRRDDPGQASARGDRALEKLRDLERRLQGAQPDDRRRALGETQLEAQQVADAQRRIADEAKRLGEREQPSGDTARRLAGDKERLADRVDQLEKRLRDMTSNAAGEDRAAVAGAAEELGREQVARRMRESAAAMRQAEKVAAPSQNGKGTATQAEQDQRRTATQKAAQADEALARTLERVADQMRVAGSPRDAESRKLSEELARTRELQERLREVDRKLEQLARSGERSGAQPNGREAGSSSQNSAGPPANPAGQQAGQEGAGEAGRGQGNGGGAQPGDVARSELQREAQELLDAMRQQGGLGGTPQGQQFSLSAPGTEAFKQDFARWETLRRDITLALERRETALSQKLASKETEDRLNAGADQRMPGEYRKLVAKYYQSLAAKKKE